jgi:predicted RNA-binding protein with PUA-like domain
VFLSSGHNDYREDTADHHQMNRWLLKEEPTHYSYEDLEHDGHAVWDGVHNPTALQNIRAMRPGDLGLYYHTGEVRAAVGIMEIAGMPYPNPSDPRTSFSVEVRPVRRLACPIPLATLKADPLFAPSPLVRISRLTVVPITSAQWQRVLRLERALATEVRRPSRSTAPTGRPERSGTAGRRRRPPVSR